MKTVLNILPQDSSNNTVQQVFIPMKHVTDRQMEASSYVVTQLARNTRERNIVSVVFSLLMFQSIYIIQFSEAGEPHRILFF